MRCLTGERWASIGLRCRSHRWPGGFPGRSSEQGRSGWPADKNYAGGWRRWKRPALSRKGQAGVGARPSERKVRQLRRNGRGRRFFHYTRQSALCNAWEHYSFTAENQGCSPDQGTPAATDGICRQTGALPMRVSASFKMGAVSGGRDVPTQRLSGGGWVPRALR